MVADNGTPSAPIPPGGAPLSLDMADERDRGLVRQAIKSWPRRWRNLDAAKRAQLVESLMLADEAARSIDDPVEKAKAIASIVRTGVMMEGQHQADQHAVYKVMQPQAAVNVNLGVLVKVIKGVNEEML